MSNAGSSAPRDSWPPADGCATRSPICGSSCKETAAEDETVIAAATMTGEHTGVFNGIEPTGKRINHKQVHIFTVAGGQITHHRAVRDDLGLLLQLGWRP